MCLIWFVLWRWPIWKAMMPNWESKNRSFDALDSKIKQSTTVTDANSCRKTFSLTLSDGNCLLFLKVIHTHAPILSVSIQNILENISTRNANKIKQNCFELENKNKRIKQKWIAISFISFRFNFSFSTIHALSLWLAIANWMAYFFQILWTVKKWHKVC